MATDHRRRGQALVELAVGMMVVALILAALFGFSKYIIESLRMHRTLRAQAGRSALTSSGGDGSFCSASDSETITVDPVAADYVFGSQDVTIKEEVHIPPMRLQGQ